MEQTAEILARLDALGVAYEYHEHPPVHKALDRYDMGLDFGACVCKNLFLTTRNESAFYVLMLQAEKNADLRRPIASTTKIVTALTVLRLERDLTRAVTIPANCCGV